MRTVGILSHNQATRESLALPIELRSQASAKRIEPLLHLILNSLLLNLEKTW